MTTETTTKTLDVDTLPLQDAIDLKTRLVGEMEAIQAQLGDANRIDPMTGERMSYEDYQAWRRRAISALRAKQNDVRELKAHIHRLSNEGTWGLLARCYKFLSEASDRFELVDDDEMVAQADELLEAIEAEVPGKLLNAN